jgi:PTS system fructose-specific IIB component
MKIVAVTSCATGIAHSYMAAEALEKAGKEAGDDIKVEAQGALGIENELSIAEIQQADLVIWANDVAIRKSERFANVKIFQLPPTAVIADAKKQLVEAKRKAGLI